MRAMQKHGLILAYDGTSMFVSGASDDRCGGPVRVGAPDDRWDNDMLALLREIEAEDFEAVDISSLIVDPGSGQVRR